MWYMILYVHFSMIILNVLFECIQLHNSVQNNLTVLQQSIDRILPNMLALCWHNMHMPTYYGFYYAGIFDRGLLGSYCTECSVFP